MDDIIIVVIVFIVITLSLVRYMKRNAEESGESEENPWQHLPKDMNPETYASGTAPPTRRNPSPPPRAQETGRAEPNARTSPPLLTEETEEETDFDINSPEEVRRGIIWSEILSRKY